MPFIMPSCLYSDKLPPIDVDAVLTSPTPNPSHRLTKYLAFPNFDHCQWWHRVGFLFGEMLHRAGYSLDEQYQYLTLFALHIVPLLGPYPCPTQHHFLSIFGTLGPLELSQNFTRDGVTVRLGFEPRSHEAVFGNDRHNLHGIDDALNTFHKLAIPFDAQLYHRLASKLALTEPEKQQVAANNIRILYPSAAQFMLGLDFNHSDVTLKLYIIAGYKAALHGIEVSTLILDAIHSIYPPPTPNPFAASLSHLESFLAEETMSNRTQVNFLSCDLVDPSITRFKIYTSTFRSDPASITHCWTLGGRLTDQETRTGLNLLLRLLPALRIPDYPSFSVLDMSAGAVFPADAQPVTYNYELRAGRETPQPKIYLPVGVSGMSEAEVADVLGAFFGELGWGFEYKREFVDGLVPWLDLNQTRGFQSWVAFAYCERKGPYVTVYFR